MLRIIDDFLNNITMYRLVLYLLIFLSVTAAVLSLFGVLPFSLPTFVLSVLILVFVSSLTNFIFAKIFHAPRNVESVYITALILSLIITPIHSFDGIFFLIVPAVLAQASKYILAIDKKHIFNPAAFAVFVTGLVLNPANGGASWWVGNIYLLPFVAIGGLLVVRKLRRFDLALSFLVTYFIVTFGPLSLVANTPILFFAFIMLTEPQTTPPSRKFRILYGVLVGLLFTQIPELALLLGNIFSYIVSPKGKLILTLKEKIKIASDTYEFIFAPSQKFSYIPGQYMEWTLNYQNPDTRGNRRYFTLASSPFEEDLRLGIKFNQNLSSFKKALLSLPANSEIVASGLSGDFTLPSDTTQKLCFIAGGIGITPFRSMIKYLLDKNEKRDIVLFYSNSQKSDIAYQDIFDDAFQKLGIKTIYVVTEEDGHIDDKMIKNKVSEYKDRIFYISGPHKMVEAFKEILKKLEISKRQIKVDFFPGYA